MHLVRNGRLILPGGDMVAGLVKDFLNGQYDISAEAPELVLGARVQVQSMTDRFFAVRSDEVNNLPLPPMTSWALSYGLDGSNVSLTTVCLARLDDCRFALAYPEDLVIGPARRHYRIMTTGDDSFQLSVNTKKGSFFADVVNVSFSGMKVKPIDSWQTVGDEKEVIVKGRHRGILFSEAATVAWDGDGTLGLVLKAPADQTSTEHAWNNIVRRMAYDKFMGNGRAA